MSTPKSPSKLLLTINTIVNISCWLLIVIGMWALLLSPFSSATWFEFTFDIKEPIELNSMDGKTYDGYLTNMKGAAIFTEGMTALIVQRVYNFLVNFLFICLIFNFKKFVNAITENQAFSQENYRRLRYMGGLLLLYILLKVSYFFLFVQAVLPQISHEAFNIQTTFSWREDIDWGAFVVGLIFLTMAEVFKEGLMLKEEATLTI
ncbi:MAG: DUF2975 domain-containing protein [Bacteroidota bacterium]